MRKLIAMGMLLFTAVAFGQTFPVNNLQINGVVSGNVTGTGNVVLQNNATLATPNLGTPTAVNLVNGTNLPITTGVLGLGSGVATGLTQAATGTGGPVLQTSPSLLGVPTAPTATAGTNTTQLASTGYVARHAPCVSILDYGGNNTGSANNDTAYTAAIAAFPNTATNVCVFFPAGTYTFAGQAAYTFAASYVGVTLEGAGPEVTTLSWGSSGGLKFTYLDGTDSVRVRGMSLTTSATNSGNGIFFTTVATSLASAALSSVENVSIRGTNGYFGTQYFNTGIYVDRVSNINFSGLNLIGPGTPAGTGVSLNGTSSVLGIVYNFVNCTIDQWNDGLTYGPYIQGVQIANSNFTFNNAGIFVPASEVGLSQLNVVNSQFSNVQFNILANSAVPAFTAIGNLFLVQNNTSGINLQATSNTTIIGNQFLLNSGSPSNLFGVIENGWVVGGSMITGNVFYNLTTGISLQAGSKNVNVQSNLYQANGTNTSNAGTGNVIGGGSP